MGTILTVLMLLVCVLLIIVVLIQNSKGGGLATGSAGSQLMGVKRTTDFLEKATWTLGLSLLGLALISKMVITKPSQGTQGESEIKENIGNMPAPSAKPTATPANQPTGNQQAAPAQSTPATPAN